MREGAEEPRYTLSEETAQQWNQCSTDECHTASGHELLDALGLRAGVVVSISLQQVDAAPNGEAGTESDHKDQKNNNYVIEMKSC